VDEIVRFHRKRRACLVDAINKLGWAVPKPRARCLVWAPIPEPFGQWPLEFGQVLESRRRVVAVSPGPKKKFPGLGEYGEGLPCASRSSTNEPRIKQALRGLKNVTTERGTTHP